MSSKVRRGVVLLLVSAACLIPLRMTAQPRTLSETTPGQRVQLVLRDSLRQGPFLPARHVVVGRFSRVAADSVWIRPYGASEFGVARPLIRHARVSLGTSRLRSAVTLGFGWGFAVAAAVAIDQLDEDHANERRDLLVGAGVGAGAGLLVGSISPFEHWRSVKR